MEMLLTLIAVRGAFEFSYGVKKSSWTFEAESGASFRLWTETDTDPMFVGLVQKGAADFVTEIAYSHYQDRLYFACSANISRVFPYSMFWPKFAGSKDFSGIINESGRYHLIGGSCMGIRAGFTVFYELKNPRTHLSLDIYPVVWIYPILLAIHGLALIVWLLSWLRNAGCSLKTRLHLCLTLFFVYNFATQCVVTINTNKRSQGSL
jgi:hypothetical protein